MTKCPMSGRRPCAVPDCPMLARPSYLTCWHHAAPPDTGPDDDDEWSTASRDED